MCAGDCLSTPVRDSAGLAHDNMAHSCHLDITLRDSSGVCALAAPICSRSIFSNPVLMGRERNGDMNVRLLSRHVTIRKSSRTTDEEDDANTSLRRTPSLKVRLRATTARDTCSICADVARCYA